ncbi:hypothetical protein [Streptomyces sp. NPDC019937]|uniref:hypothetical protein n=1 Tax=Streptomyces sp. NPDC019937 TaxID=3154787 RepID=UPI0033CB9351
MRPSILVVEDDQALRDVLRRGLYDEDFGMRTPGRTKGHGHLWGARWEVHHVQPGAVGILVAASSSGVACLNAPGFRGGVSLAPALAWPTVLDSGAPFPDRDTIVTTLVVQGLLLPSVVRRARLLCGTSVAEECFLAETTATEEALKDSLIWPPAPDRPRHQTRQGPPPARRPPHRRHRPPASAAPT